MDAGQPRRVRLPADTERRRGRHSGRTPAPEPCSTRSPLSILSWMRSTTFWTRPPVSFRCAIHHGRPRRTHALRSCAARDSTPRRSQKRSLVRPPPFGSACSSAVFKEIIRTCKRRNPHYRSFFLHILTRAANIVLRSLSCTPHASAAVSLCFLLIRRLRETKCDRRSRKMLHKFQSAVLYIFQAGCK